MNKSPFIYSYDNKRYHTLNYHNRQVFGEKVFKAVLNCGFTCPNIDGSKGIGGCIFCGDGSGYFTHNGLSVEEQLKKETDRISASHGNVPIIAYFQANTNTYAPTERLRELYDIVLKNERVKGISIATRADCLSDETLDLLSELSHKTRLTVELGMQTVHEKTISLINRCCSHEEFLEGYHRLKQRNIAICLHIINSLPFETEEMMIETARQTAVLKPDSVKLQMLHIIRDTPIAEMYDQGRFQLLSRDEYINIIVRQLELLPPETVIERLTGDGDKRTLIAPLWTTNKIAVLGGIDSRLASLNTWQGRLFPSASI